MDITAFVGKLLEQDDVDALREGVRVLAQAVMERAGACAYEVMTLSFWPCGGRKPLIRHVTSGL